jgi:hypothetical protein
MRWAVTALVCAVVGTGWWAFAASPTGGVALVALLVGTMAALGTLLAAANNGEVLSGVGLIVTALFVPTYFAYLANLVSLAVGVGLIIHGTARRRSSRL